MRPLALLTFVVIAFKNRSANAVWNLAIMRGALTIHFKHIRPYGKVGSSVHLCHYWPALFCAQLADTSCPFSLAFCDIDKFIAHNRVPNVFSQILKNLRLHTGIGTPNAISYMPSVRRVAVLFRRSKNVVINFQTIGVNTFKIQFIFINHCPCCLSRKDSPALFTAEFPNASGPITNS